MSTDLKPKFQKWIKSKLYHNDHLDENALTDYCLLFQRYEQKIKSQGFSVDIFKYRDISDIRTVLDLVGQSRKDARKEIITNDTIRLSTDNWDMWLPLTFEAAKVLSIGTNWCVKLEQRFFDSHDLVITKPKENIFPKVNGLDFSMIGTNLRNKAVNQDMKEGFFGRHKDYYFSHWTACNSPISVVPKEMMMYIAWLFEERYRNIKFTDLI